MIASMSAKLRHCGASRTKHCSTPVSQFIPDDRGVSGPFTNQLEISLLVADPV
jgi:hypothetical protein